MVSAADIKSRYLSLQKQEHHSTQISAMTQRYSLLVRGYLDLPILTQQGLAFLLSSTRYHAVFSAQCPSLLQSSGFQIAYGHPYLRELKYIRIHLSSNYIKSAYSIR